MSEQETNVQETNVQETNVQETNVQETSIQENPLQKLIEEALLTDELFVEKMQYWVHKRKRVPQLDYIMSHLLRIYGEEKLVNSIKNR